MPVILPDAKAQEDWINPRGQNPLSLKRLLIPALDDLAAGGAGIEPGQPQ
jgi:hypothetical protein